MEGSEFGQKQPESIAIPVWCEQYKQCQQCDGAGTVHLAHVPDTHEAIFKWHGKLKSYCRPSSFLHGYRLSTFKCMLSEWQCTMSGDTHPPRNRTTNFHCFTGLHNVYLFSKPSNSFAMRWEGLFIENLLLVKLQPHNHFHMHLAFLHKLSMPSKFMLFWNPKNA